MDKAHPVGCDCEGCMSAYTPEQRAAHVPTPARVWAEDAKEAGKLHRRVGENLWHVAYLVAVNCQPSKGGRPRKETATDGLQLSERVSFRQFADVAGITDVTVGRYYQTWLAAAEAGLVPAPDMLSKSEPAIQLKKLTADDWSDNYPARAVAAPVSVSSGSSGTKASGARSSARAVTPTGTSAASAVTGADRTPVSAEPSVAGQPTYVPENDPANFNFKEITVIPGTIETDAPLLKYSKLALAAVQDVRNSLKQDYPLDDASKMVLADLLNVADEVRNALAARLAVKPSAPVARAGSPRRTRRQK